MLIGGFSLAPGQIIEFDYTNWRGEKARRKAKFARIYWGSNEYHTKQQFLVSAIDLDKDQLRTFAAADMENLVIVEHEEAES